MTLIAIHLLQSHGPSNLNRDENGDPKDCIFGGVRRGRISSQAIKRSIRTSEEFRHAFGHNGLLAKRSQMASHIKQYIESLPEAERIDIDKERLAIILRQAAKLGKADKQSDDKSKDTTDEQTDDVAPITDDDGKSSKAQLVFLTHEEVAAVARKLLELSTQKVPVKRGKGKSKKDVEVSFADLSADELRSHLPVSHPLSVDIAMFGRMTTSTSFEDMEAAVQVAHALSTHKIEPEYDFFTAVDEYAQDSGAGLLGDTAFNSATYYKYINIHWQGLLSNLGGQRELAVTAVQALLRAAMTAIPTGKQNTFAAHNLPDVALVEVLKRNIPLNYANAFLKPVRPQEHESLLDASAAALIAYATHLPGCYGLPVQRALFTTPLVTLPNLDEHQFQAKACPNTDALAEWLATHMPAAEV